jgi:ring-1,2-phenylacetyl-CoA epoxidase subunit PaaA
VLLRWHIKSELNETLRAAYVQKYVPLLHSYGFKVPDPELHFNDDTKQWVAGTIDWEPLKAAMNNVGPDSRRRIENAAQNWSDTAWVRDALDVQPVGAG